MRLACAPFAPQAEAHTKRLPLPRRCCPVSAMGTMQWRCPRAHGARRTSSRKMCTAAARCARAACAAFGAETSAPIVCSAHQALARRRSDAQTQSRRATTQSPRMAAFRLLSVHSNSPSAQHSLFALPKCDLRHHLQYKSKK